MAEGSGMKINLNSRQLWRAVYIRKGVGCSVTFSATDLIDAQVFVDRYERMAKVDVLTYLPLGMSKISEKPYSRLSRRVSAAANGGV